MTYAKSLLIRTWQHDPELQGRANLPDDPENNAPYFELILFTLHLMLMAPRTDVSSLNLAPESNGLHRLVHHYFSPGMPLQLLAGLTQSEEKTGWFLLGRLEDPSISRVFVLVELGAAGNQERG
uniref:Uncharacterized protein n=1 Tax=Hordeum vulgare subsp. vulgare TaxID=112509 RepID=A0A8I6YBK9_HORVV